MYCSEMHGVDNFKPLIYIDMYIYNLKNDKNEPFTFNKVDTFRKYNIHEIFKGEYHSIKDESY